MNFRVAATPIAPRLLVIGGIAGLVIFVGLRLAGGEPPEPTTLAGDPIVTFPADLPNPTLPPQILRPVTQATVIIEGKEIALPAGVVYTRAGGARGAYALLRFDSNPADLEDSWIMLDLSGKILETRILPEDNTVFAELLRKADVVLAPTATPVNRVIIAGKEVLLPEGMSYQQIINPNRPGRQTRAIIYGHSSRISRVALDENGDILASEVLPEHKEVFRPLLPSVYLPE